MSIQFSYYRNIHASHMILTPALEGEPWEKEMLWRNRPRELILPEYNSRNGQTQLWYDRKTGSGYVSGIVRSQL